MYSDGHENMHMKNNSFATSSSLLLFAFVEAANLIDAYNHLSIDFAQRYVDLPNLQVNIQ